MYKITDYAKTMISVLNNLIQRGVSGENAWMFVTRFDFENYDGYDGDIPFVTGFLSVACYADSNYVRVLAAFSDAPPGDPSALDWQPIVWHDTAWRSDGVASALKECDSQMWTHACARLQCSAGEITRLISMDRIQRIRDPESALATGLSKGASFERLSISIG